MVKSDYELVIWGECLSPDSKVIKIVSLLCLARLGVHRNKADTVGGIPTHGEVSGVLGNRRRYR